MMVLSRCTRGIIHGECHTNAVSTHLDDRRMCELMPQVAKHKVALSESGECNIVMGLAVVENAYDQTMLLEVHEFRRINP